MKLFAVIALFAALPGFAQTAESSSVRSHRILGVPFVRWGDAAGLKYEMRDIVNPSLPAAEAMVAGYWGSPRTVVEGSGLKNWTQQLHEDQSLEALKKMIDSDVPVIVVPPLTPFAHLLNPSLGLAAALTPGLLPEPKNHSTRLLGQMLSLEDIDRIDKTLSKRPDGKRPSNESMLLAARVVTGYDDARQVVFLHCPSFGPDWEVSYSDFDRMWSLFGRHFIELRPKTGTRPPSTVPAIARTPDNEAARLFVYGYAQSELGQTEQAVEALKRGLALSGIGVGYQHLLHFELAHALNVLGQDDAAIAEAERAVAIYPDNGAANMQLAEALRCCGKAPDAKRRAADLEKSAKKSCSLKGEQKVARVLANDFFLRGCTGAFLGWGVR